MRQVEFIPTTIRRPIRSRAYYFSQITGIWSEL